MHNETLLTAEQLASLLQVTPYTIAKWTREGRIPAAIKQGKKFIRYRADDVLNTLQKDDNVATNG
jgi:excisionase family DNA binding protein